VRDWGELLRLAADEKKWQAHVNKCVMYMEMEVAQQTGERREREEDRNWQPNNTKMLRERRAKVVEKVLKPKIRRQA
jgi:hypothetical protein